MDADEWKPLTPRRAVLADGGTLYVTYESGVTKFANGVWTDISPPAVGRYNGITVDPTNPNIVMTAIEDGANTPAPIYGSTNGGVNWSQITFVKHQNVPWWTSNWFAANTSTLTIDPHFPNRVWLTDFYGTWRTDDITASPSHWYTYEEGHEEVVTFALRSTPIGAPLISGHADVDGMRHTSLTTYPSSKLGSPSLGDTVSIDFQESNPNFIARVGSTRYAGSGAAATAPTTGQPGRRFPIRPESQAVSPYPLAAKRWSGSHSTEVRYIQLTVDNHGHREQGHHQEPFTISGSGTSR